MKKPEIIPDEHTVRREKLERLRRRGLEPFPSSCKPTHSLGAIASNFDQLVVNEDVITITGRVLAIRAHGGSTFLNISDGTGRLQAYGKRDGLGDDAYNLFNDLDVGDFLELTGKLFTTKVGERTLLISTPPRFLAKSLRPLPEKWHGLTDTELRYRKRYLDLLVNEDVRRGAVQRANLVRAIRHWLDDRGYLEVETPALQTIPGGATARPFATHLNALDLDLYLRVAPELYLKRLLVAGFTKVYEVARCFRNEGIDHSHNPEFTQIELYEAYANYRDYMRLVEQLFAAIVPQITGSAVVNYDGRTVDLTPPYEVINWTAALNSALKTETLNLSDDELAAISRKHGVDITAADKRGAILDAAYKKLVRPNFERPTFLIDHPTCLSPLAKPKADDAQTVERFQLLLPGGIELMNGFSELNDPDIQRERFLEQEALREAGDEEAQRIDEDYLEALEHGMPPAAGLGIGIDRLAAVLAGCHSLREIILFPTLRPTPRMDRPE